MSVPTGTTRRRRGRPWRVIVVGTLLLGGLIVALALVLATPAPRAPLDLDVLESVVGAQVTEVRFCTLAPQDDLPEEIRAEHPPGSWVSSGVINGCPAAFDGQRVRFVGEAVGDLLPRRDGAWVLVNDDDYALDVGPLAAHRVGRGLNTGLSVWLTSEFANRVEHLGRPGVHGDVVEVVGTIVREDPTDGGGLTLRAEALRVVRGGGAVDEPLHVPTLVLALSLSGLALAASIARWRSARTGPPRHVS